VKKLLGFQVGAAGSKLEESEFAVLREHWKAHRAKLEGQSNE